MIELPKMFLVRQKFTDRHLEDISGSVKEQMASLSIPEWLKPGARIAIGVGSRGINNISVIVKSVVDHFQAAGFKPFIFPAMGSHGGGTAEGQKRNPHWLWV